MAQPQPPLQALQGAEAVDAVLRDWPTPAPALLNASLAYNATYNCTNDYCLPDEEYLDLIETYVFPTTYEWLLIALHAAVFCVGLVGNALVCAAVYRNPGMRTVTNVFLVNLAVADFLVILLCLPPTVVWDVTETWFMGMALCKVVLYFQSCFPLAGKWLDVTGSD
ncbi:Orexin receptor type 2 [Frankliniella fusca]|uniref:Orexin receptor type 2 n=1 Tax=Frankliniella fusca TaxID=407009 RepID=A0AAE1I1Y3_9NEOP|nr:Orexin receptor type 2 [Frankliniella fusca]